jgi:Suppressor of fused protein (SUFU)
MGFWERTWKERSDAIELAYGKTSPPDMVISFSWPDRVRCPGACALRFPPIMASRDPLRHSRCDWLYMTMGLSQPQDMRQVEIERAAGKSYSSYGIEFAFVVQEDSSWVPSALRNFITYQTEGENIEWGHRFPFGFYRDTNGELAAFTGDGESAGFEPVGAIRAVLFWPYLFPDSEFLTSTGKFLVLVATGITEREWQHARSTTTAHLLLLLCRAGIAQRTIYDRACLISDPRWQAEWSLIEGMSPQECEAEIEAGINRWHTVDSMVM